MMPATSTISPNKTGPIVPGFQSMPTKRMSSMTRWPATMERKDRCRWGATAARVKNACMLQPSGFVERALVLRPIKLSSQFHLAEQTPNHQASKPPSPSSIIPVGEREYLGKPFANKADNNRRLINLACTGSVMPPPAAVAGTYEGPDGKKIKVAPLSDEDRMNLVRWIDLGCPIDLAFDAKNPRERGAGWMIDDHRPTLALTYPRAGANESLSRILIGMHDYDSGLDLDRFEVTADFPIDGVAARANLARRFKSLSDNRWEVQLARPITTLPRGVLTVSVKDKQGNLSRIERTFSVAAAMK